MLQISTLSNNQVTHPGNVWTTPVTLATLRCTRKQVASRWWSTYLCKVYMERLKGGSQHSTKMDVVYLLFQMFTLLHLNTYGPRQMPSSYYTTHPALVRLMPSANIAVWCTAPYHIPIIACTTTVPSAPLPQYTSVAVHNTTAWTFEW